MEVSPMWSDLLLALAWLVIVFVPAIVAARQPLRISKRLPEELNGRFGSRQNGNQFGR
jgi:hypothetical protein